jgi:rhodanese-related sulfurtransferase
MQNITVEQLKARVDAGEKLNLIDVREDIEHDEFNIGGIWYRVARIQQMEIEELEHLKNEEVICYCRSGQRSTMACLMLEHMGFTDTYNLTGGMVEWRDKFNV